jgi:hypothetical protein
LQVRASGRLIAHRVSKARNAEACPGSNAAVLRDLRTPPTVVP